MRRRFITAGVCALAIGPVIAAAAPFTGSRQGPASQNPANTKLETRVTGQTGGSHQVAATATVINFNDRAEGDTLGAQYAGLGVTFSPDPAIASTTDMTATDITTGDVGALGTPALVSGKVIHSFGGWLAETDDPNVLATFSSPQGFLSIDFAGNGLAPTFVSEIDLYDSNSTLLGFVLADPTGQADPYQQTVSFTDPTNSIAFAVIWPGDFGDWVAWDNFTYDTVIPEPASISGLALASLVAVRRRR